MQNNFTKTYLTDSPKKTRQIGKKLAESILLRFPFKEKGTVLALSGDLGGGKTTFLQGFAKGLGIKNRVLSPTFVIMKKYKISKAKRGYFYHIDCYRINSSEDLKTIGFDEIIKDRFNIVAIEWAERIEDILPRKRIEIKFDFLSYKERMIEISYPLTINLKLN